MRLKISTHFKVEVWDKRFLLKELKQNWTKAIFTDQGLDRVGDGYWIKGIHVGSMSNSFDTSSTEIGSQVAYTQNTLSDVSYTSVDDDNVTWYRDLEFRFDKSQINNFMIRELSLSWDSDKNTATSLLSLNDGVSIGDNQELVIFARVSVVQDKNHTKSGEINLGSSTHRYQIKTCFTDKFVDGYIGSELSQKEGRVYSGVIPQDVRIEPSDAIDSNLAVFKQYSFKVLGKEMTNFFTLSSPNSDTRTVTSHTFGLPSAYGVEFDPPIDKSMNRELTLSFSINWDRG